MGMTSSQFGLLATEVWTELLLKRIKDAQVQCRERLDEIEYGDAIDKSE